MSDQQAGNRKEPPPTPATRAYMDAALEMHRNMNVHYRNDADIDFAATLQAQHKGAADIARVELKYGTDPEMRALAEQVLRAQEQDKALIDAWRAKHPAP